MTSSSRDIRSRTARRIRRGQLTARVAVPPTNDEIAELATTMNAMLARVEQAAALRARSALQVRTELQPVQVICDPQRTAQVVANIVQNAERHAASMILIRCARDGEEGRIEVVNDGPPVADQDRERVFDRFIRREPSRAGADDEAQLGGAG